MTRHGKPCIFPGPNELELGVIPGCEPGTAIRVGVEPGRDGYARIEQLAYSDDLGWYTQKSFCVPAAMVRDLITFLRKADCFLPRTPGARAGDEAPIPFHPPVEPQRDDEAVRRDA